MKQALLLLAMLLLLAPVSGTSRAVEPNERLADPMLEARAREISAELRCLVCQNQSIDDSNAPLARDLRVLLRERLKAGDSDGEAKAFLVARYGDFVLLRPPLRPETYLLWFGPLAVILLAGGGLYLAWRRKRRGAVAEIGTEPPLSSAERARLEIILRDGDGSDR